MIRTDNFFREPLRAFQVESACFLHTHKRVILALPMGAGKTRVALEAIEMDYTPLSDTLAHNILILCGKNAQPTWEIEIEKWFTKEYGFTYLTGTPQYRAITWKELLAMTHQNTYNFFVCTYATWVKDSKYSTELQELEWDYIIIDEAQKLRNRKIITTKECMKLGRRTSNLYLISGKPVRKGPQDLWTLISMINPKMFPSFWKFVKTFCIVDDYGFGQEILGVRNVGQLRSILAGIMIRHTEEDVNKELPEKTRIPLIVVPSAQQRRLYDQLVEDMLAWIDTPDGKVFLATPSELGVITKIRQLLVCPKVLDSRLSNGTGIDTIVERLEEESHVTIFIPFTGSIVYIVEALLKAGYEDIFVLRGGMEPKKIREACEQFELTRGIMICSIEFAESFSLPSCSIGYFLGSSWNPDTNEQAEDRLRRLSSHSRHLTIFYIQYKDTIDEQILEILNKKHRNVLTILRNPADIKQLLARK